jgi:hypothetical protein
MVIKVVRPRILNNQYHPEHEEKPVVEPTTKTSEDVHGGDEITQSMQDQRFAQQQNHGQKENRQNDTQKQNENTSCQLRGGQKYASSQNQQTEQQQNTNNDQQNDLRLDSSSGQSNNEDHQMTGQQNNDTNQQPQQNESQDNDDTQQNESQQTTIAHGICKRHSQQNELQSSDKDNQKQPQQNESQQSNNDQQDTNNVHRNESQNNNDNHQSQSNNESSTEQRDTNKMEQNEKEHAGEQQDEINQQNNETQQNYEQQNNEIEGEQQNETEESEERILDDSISDDYQEQEDYENDEEYDNEDEFYEEDEEQVDTPRYNTQQVFKINVKHAIKRRLYLAFYRLVEYLSDEEKQPTLLPGQTLILNVKKLMMRQYERKPLDAYYYYRTRSQVILILDNSGSMTWLVTELNTFFKAALKRKDVQIYVAPNGHIEEYYNDKTKRFEVIDHQYAIQQIIKSSLPAIYVGDFDGANTPIELSWTNRVYWICTEKRYKYFSHHDWVGRCLEVDSYGDCKVFRPYHEDDFKGFFGRTSDDEEMITVLKEFAKNVYKQHFWYDKHDIDDFRAENR